MPFAVFFVCCVLQFPVFGSLGSTLRSRHPEQWASLRRSWIGWPVFDREWSFMLSGKYRALDDPKLTRKVKDARRLSAVALSSWTLYAISIFAVGTLRN
jgi:hypothetical protein